jgi:HNH endonuclease
MAEVWKPVPSIPGLLASSEGRVLIPPCYAPLPNGGYRLYETKPVEGAVTKAAATSNHTYRGLYWKKHGNIKVHRAVCEAFHGPSPFEGAVVIHLDEDAHNNRPENLRWGTQKENMNMPKFKAWQRSEARNDNIRRKRRTAA